VNVRLSQLHGKVQAHDFQNQLWTIIASGIFAVFPSLLVFIASRQVGIALAGMLIHAVALVDLPVILTLFGTTQIQRVDVKQETHFNVYLWFRAGCALITTAIFIIYLVIAGFDAMQLAIISLVYIIFMTNAFADVFMGDLQQKGKMRVAGRMQASCFGVSLIAAVVVLITTHSLTTALIAASAIVVFGYILWIWNYRKHFVAVRVKFDFSATKKLVKIALPLLIGWFIMTYLFNAQKYYLDAFFSVEAVAVFGFMLLPLSLINLACTGFFQGAIPTKTATIYASGQIDHFKRRINLQLLYAIVLFIPFMAVIHFFGIPVLSWIYAVDLSLYYLPLMLLTAGTIARAPFFILGPVLVMFRKQKAILFSSILITIIAGPLLWFLVRNYSIQGAAFSSIVIYIPQAVVYYVLYRVALKQAVVKG